MMTTATLAFLLVLSTLSRAFSPSRVFFFDQIPAEIYSEDPDIVAHKEIVHVRKDFHFLETGTGPNLTCLANGQVQLEYPDASAASLDVLTFTNYLGHPIIIPSDYDSSHCPHFQNHTLFGPKAYIPQDILG